MGRRVLALAPMGMAIAIALACVRAPTIHVLPEGVRVSSLGAGRYAMVLEGEERGGCSMSHFFSTSRAIIVVSLDDDGSATGCRGRRWISTVESNMPLGETDPHPDVTELVEQQGMRGTWRTSGDALRIDLALDDSICPRLRNAASEEARPWSLECVAIAPTDSSQPSTPPKPGEEIEPPFPVLACHLLGFDEPGTGAYPHDTGYTVAEPYLFFGRDTIFLAPSPGVVIEEHAYGGLSPEGMREWKRPATPIAFDAFTLPN
jgi:hypothetical protein